MGTRGKVGKGPGDPVKKLGSGNPGPGGGPSLICCGVSSNLLPLSRPVFSLVKAKGHTR